jgi:hypothetical protein
MRCHWIAPRFLLICIALVLGAPPSYAQPHFPKVITIHLDYHLEPTDDMVVRLLSLPQQYDDKGYPKKYTADELKELKGDNPKLIGYQGSVDDLKSGQQVRVYLLREVPPPKGNAQPDKSDNAANPDKPDKPKYVAAGQLVGQLTQTGNSNKGMKVRVSYRAWEGTPQPKENARKFLVGMIVILSPP